MASPYDLEGKWVLITGASSGIGHYFAELFAAQGCNLVLAARNTERLAELVSELGNKHEQSIQALPLDLTQPQSIEALAAHLARENIRLDVLINNAGVAENAYFVDTDYEQMRQVMATNFEGAWYLTKLLCEQLIAVNHGASIIYVSSVLAEFVTQRVSVYAASKAALLQTTKVQALELARYQIRVNCISPGYILTPLNEAFFASDAGQKMIKRIPQRRLGRYEDLRGPLLLLASPLSAYITGSNIRVDGGHGCHSL